MNCLGAHRRAVGVPEARAHHVLDGALLAVGELHPGLALALADAGPLAAPRAGALARVLAALRARADAGVLAAVRAGADAGPLAALRADLLDALAGVLAAQLAGLGLQRLAVPLRVAEVVVRLDEVVDREVVLAVVEPRAAADDLLELDHRVDRAASARCCGCCGRRRRSRASARS